MPNLTSSNVAAGDDVEISNHNTVVADLTALNNALENYVTAGGTNTIVLNPSPAITAYRTGMRFVFRAENTSTNNVSLQCNSVAAAQLYVNNRRAGLRDVQSGELYEVVYTGSRWDIVASSLHVGYPDVGVLTGEGTITWNVKRFPKARITLPGNRTLANPSNAVADEVYILSVIQDATGSRTITWGSAFLWTFLGGSAPTLSTAANSRDLLGFYYDGTNMRCVAFLKGY